jgi:hypothetical protein
VGSGDGSFTVVRANVVELGSPVELHAIDIRTRSQGGLLAVDSCVLAFALHAIERREKRERMEAAVVHRLRRILIGCCHEAFEAMRVDLSLVESASGEFTCTAPVAAFVGVVGTGLRGTITIVGPFPLMCALYPLALKSDAEAALDVLDWTGEIANQVAGSFSNRLAADGIEAYPSTPKVFLTERLSSISLSRGSLCELRFEAPLGTIGIWLDAATTNEAELFPASRPDEPNVKTGKLILF